MTPSCNQEKSDEKFVGIVKWFNRYCHYGFITREDTKEDMFVHQTGVIGKRILFHGETATFNIRKGRKGEEAFAVRVKRQNGNTQNVVSSTNFKKFNKAYEIGVQKTWCKNPSWCYNWIRKPRLALNNRVSLHQWYHEGQKYR